LTGPTKRPPHGKRPDGDTVSPPILAGPVDHHTTPHHTPHHTSHYKDHTPMNPTVNPTTEQGAAALDEFGFCLVELDRPGAPTPGRIADRIHDIVAKLSDARSPGCAVAAVAELRRLNLALDAYDAGMLRLDHNQKR
jgi:hypothetical protein